MDRNQNAVPVQRTCKVEARESLVDRNYHRQKHHTFLSVEARESLVDRNNIITSTLESVSCRGSREPRGSKFTVPCRPVADALVEARESLVDRNTIFPMHSSGTFRRGSREPRGSKYHIPEAVVYGILSRLARASWIEIFMHSFHAVAYMVEARESLVDRN